MAYSRESHCLAEKKQKNKKTKKKRNVCSLERQVSPRALGPYSSGRGEEGRETELGNSGAREISARTCFSLAFALAFSSAWQQQGAARALPRVAGVAGCSVWEERVVVVVVVVGGRVAWLGEGGVAAVGDVVDWVLLLLLLSMILWMVLWCRFCYPCRCCRCQCWRRMLLLKLSMLLLLGNFFGQCCRGVHVVGEGVVLILVAGCVAVVARRVAVFDVDGVPVVLGVVVPVICDVLVIPVYICCYC